MRKLISFEQKTKGFDMNYWERQKSFWKTPKGIAVLILIIVAIWSGVLISLNFLISPYPVIESFDANPHVIIKGESVNLSWSVEGATQVKIDHGIGAVELNEFKDVSPRETTIYTLMAINGTRNRTSEIKVMVAD